MTILDAHLHLQDEPPDTLQNILCLGQEEDFRFFCNAVFPENWEQVARLAREHSRVIPFFGIHPWVAGSVRGGWEESLKGFLDAQAGGVGEIGLDKAKIKASDFTRQKEIFERQVVIANELSKPFVVHCVKAWPEIFGILRKDRNFLKTHFMFHAFSGTREILSELLALGAFISFSYKSLQRNFLKMEPLIAETPLERLLIESDAPYLGIEAAGPVADIYLQSLRETYARAAPIKKVSTEQLIQKVWENGKIFLHGTPDRQG